MPRQTVYTEVMGVLERRIAAGEYMLRDLPGERRLAEEVGVSYMTARKAVTHLIEKQVLVRRANGSLAVRPRTREGAGQIRVALLIPASPSTHLMRCRLELSEAATRRDVQFRALEYAHWDDSIVRTALDGSDGLLVIPMTEPVPTRVLNAFMADDAKVVIFDGDMTDHDIPSIRLFAREHIFELLDHLRDLGHERIDCLNTHGHTQEIERRIAHWHAWVAETGCGGSLWDDPAPAHEDLIERAHRLVLGVLRERGADLGAIVATTQAAALGAIRACHDVGVRVGREVSVCTISNGPTGRYFCPSLTGLEMPEITPLLERCFEWFAGPELRWRGDLRVVPARAKLFKGESTGVARQPA